DTGFWLEHEAVNFINKVAEYDFVFNDDNTANEPGDAGNQDSHGTQVLSVVGGKMDGFLYGPAFGADFLLGKTEDMRGETVIEEDNWVAALEWAEALGADIVTTSLGYIDWYTYKDMDGKTAITSQAAQKAAAKGVLVLVSAGNERDDPWYYITAPADADSIVTVGAVDKYGFITGFSSSGPTFDGRIKPEVVAMGQSVRMASTLCPSCYTSANGTSYATPLVAGVAALLVEAHPFWSPMQLREALINTADRSGQPDNLYGWGLVNALAAIEYRLTGDINDDDRVDRNDALLAADIWLGRHHCSGEALEKADVNGDGDINVLDVVWITRQ
ncbi:S8 family serine peptidase, partial [candidate division KSB1 bacterium]|nr:S8 family serine peptidase [candidate division KSB1 bacterium]